MLLNTKILGQMLLSMKLENMRVINFIWCGTTTRVISHQGKYIVFDAVGKITWVIEAEGEDGFCTQR